MITRGLIDNTLVTRGYNGILERLKRKFFDVTLSIKKAFNRTMER